MSLIIDEEKWIAPDKGRWSSERYQERYRPNVIQKFLLTAVDDTENNENTHVYFEYNRNTNKIFGLSNIGKTNYREVVIKIRDQHRWVRVYMITPDKKGEDYTTLDQFLDLPNLKLIKQGIDLVPNETLTITIEDNPL